MAKCSKKAQHKTVALALATIKNKSPSHVTVKKRAKKFSFATTFSANF